MGRRAEKEDTGAGRWTGYEVSPSGALVARVVAWGVGLGAPAQTGHHSRPQHPRARGERRRCPAPRGHVMRARGLEVLQRAATEREQRWALAAGPPPPPPSGFLSPLLTAARRPHPQPRRREEEETPLPAESRSQPPTVPRGLSSRRGLHLFAPRWG